MKFGRIRVHNSTLLVLIFICWLALFGPLKYRQDDGSDRRRSTAPLWRYPIYKPTHRLSKKFLPNLKIFVNEESYVDHWQRANSPSEDYKLLVFSAFFDGRTSEKCVRVIGATLTKSPPTIYCKLSFDFYLEAEVVLATKKPINEHQNLKYSAFFFNCCFRTKDIPRMISISKDKTFKVSSEMPVHDNNKHNQNFTAQFAVCVKPFHYEYNRATWLLEFLEFNRLMGVEHFFFYNHTVGADVELILNNYISLGLATVLPWELDLVSQKEIRTEGIFAALNDCLYRTMFRYEYAIMIDFDEYIVPRTQSNYSALIQDILSSSSSHRRHEPSSLIFKNVFFYLYWENDTTAYGVPPEDVASNIPYLLTQYKTRRLVTATPRGRTKYMVYPKGALEAGNHLLWRHLQDFGNIRVEESKAIMHHYRICEFGGFDCLKQKSTVDRSAHRFSSLLLTRILDQCRNIFPTLDGICPISPPLGSPW